MPCVVGLGFWLRALRGRLGSWHPSLEVQDRSRRPRPTAGCLHTTPVKLGRASVADRPARSPSISGRIRAAKSSACLRTAAPAFLAAALAVLRLLKVSVSGRGLPSFTPCFFFSPQRQPGALAQMREFLFRDQRHDPDRQAVGVGHVEGDKFDTGIAQAEQEDWIAAQPVQSRNNQLGLEPFAGIQRLLQCRSVLIAFAGFRSRRSPRSASSCHH